MVRSLLFVALLAFIACDSKSGVNAATCASQATQPKCNTAGCFWDIYLQSCWDSLAAVNAQYPCSTWSGSNPTVNGVTYNSQDMCSYHGCQPVSNTPPSGAITCYNFGQVTSTQSNNITQTKIVASFGTMTTSLGSTIVSFNITTPLATDPNRPAWPVVAIAGMTGGLNDFTRFLTPDVCNSVSVNTLTLGVSPSNQNVGETSVSIFNGIVNQLTTSKNYTFSNSTTLGKDLYKQYGYFYANSTSLVKSVQAFAPSYTQAVYTVTADLNTLVSNCSKWGAYMAYNGLTRNYFIPVTYAERVYTGWSSTTYMYQISIATGGQVTVSTAIAYTQTSTLTAITAIADNCTNGDVRQQITFNIQYPRVFDTNIKVGPRTAADITFTPNCYGDYVNSLSAVTCDATSFTCQATLVIRSRCRTPVFDGKVFEQCQYSKPADRINDMGSDIAYPIEYDFYHGIKVTPWVCPVPSGACAPANPLQPSTQLNVWASALAFPAALVVAPPIPIKFGIIQSPQTTLANAGGTLNSTTLSSTSNSSTNTGTPYIQDDGIVSVVLAVSDVILQDYYDLHVLTGPGNITFYALNANGTLMAGVPSVDYATQLAQYSAYAPKDKLDALSSPALPSCTGVKACDGFAIPVLQLQTIIPASGWRIVLAYRVNLPEPTNAGSAPTTAPGRRLLAIGDSEALMRSFDALTSYTFFVSVSNGTTEVIVNASRGNSDNTTGTWIGLGISLFLLTFIGCWLVVFFIRSKKRAAEENNGTAKPAGIHGRAVRSLKNKRERETDKLLVKSGSTESAKGKRTSVRMTY